VGVRRSRGAGVFVALEPAVDAGLGAGLGRVAALHVEDDFGAGVPAAMRAWLTPPIMRSLWRTQPTHTETLKRSPEKHRSPRLKVRKRRGDRG
jgi:hypothetical protein